MRPSEIRQLKQALARDAAEAAHRPENAVWLEPERWVAYMGQKTRGALCASFSDEELSSILRETAGRLGRNPSKKEVFCVYRVFLIERFGNWPKALAAAGLKRPRRERREANRLRDLEAMRRKEERRQALLQYENRPSGQEIQEVCTMTDEIAVTVNMEGGAG